MEDGEPYATIWTIHFFIPILGFFEDKQLINVAQISFFHFKFYYTQLIFLK